MQIPIHPNEGVDRYPSKVKRMNSILASELGSVNGFPWVQWRECRSLYWPMVIVDSEFKPVYVMGCDCGVGVRVHLESCKGLSRPIYKYEFRHKSYKWEPYPDAWVLCALVDPPSKRDWDMTFPNIAYPAHGHYCPIGDSEKTLGMLTIPQEADTWEVIGGFRDSLKRMKTFEQDYNARQEIRDKQKSNEIEDRFCELTPAFEHLPGAKDKVSLPTVKFRNKNTVELEKV